MVVAIVRAHSADCYCCVEMNDDVFFFLFGIVLLDTGQVLQRLLSSKPKRFEYCPWQPTAPRALRE